MTATTLDSPAPRRRRLAPTAELLRRAARRADIARKLRRRDVTSLLMGILLGIAGLMMPHALDRHAPHAARAAVVPGSIASDLAPPASPAGVAHDPRILERAEDGLFYATVVVNGQPIRFLVDTGASVVTLTATDARRLGVAPAAGSYGAQAETASGRAAFAWATIGTVEVAGHHVENVRAAVLAQDAGVSLLGQNLLSRLGPVRLEGDRLIIG